jgi:ATP-dependent RNA helicase DeaD
MTDIQIAAPLAAALASKGYETMTPVQNAMLGAEVAGRDLLVSAQTGSGKTVAFGIAIADELLKGADQLLYADSPMALVIAPTRELALQVARELEWLYSGANAKIATCVGGMDYRTEKRTLDRGAHIVVGTPGRLRDHIERSSLDMTGIRAVVLDEADEMLDLGFREDLEFILGTAPAERRTLMFSATVPKEIAALAKDFQRDALRIQTQGEARQHVDIEYRALSVAARDREHAIFNLLRFYESQAAIVFCKTRANVSHLFARMSNRGFQAVALSGELSQAERTHALQALRDGRARVCIATDVAARGIDLPGLDLVIHADLPSNSETLLHRSGRTGRAGKKGVSALIVVPAEFKKAQRLLQGAKLVATWDKPPSADEVQARDDLRLLDHAAFSTEVGEDADLAQTLLDRYGPPQVAAAFIRMWRDGRSAPEVLSDNLPVPERSAPRERGEFGASVWFQLSVGRSGRAEARWLLPKICEAGGITKDGIGAIRVQEDRTFVQILKEQAGKFGQGVELESGVTMTLLDGEPDIDRPERLVKPPTKTYKAAAPRAVRDEAPRAPRDEAPAEKREKPAYTPKPPRVVDEETAPVAEAVERKPYVKREEPVEKKPYVKREETAERKPYVKRDDAEKKPYVKREETGEKKPYAPRGAGEKAPYAAKPYAKRDDSKPYASKPDGERKPWVKREAPADGAPKARAWAKPEGKSEGFKPRSAGFKSHGGSADKPGKSAGFKSHGAEGKSFAKARPAAPKVDAKDTSKRFVPPKKK